MANSAPEHAGQVERIRAALAQSQLPLFVARFRAGNRPTLEAGTLERAKIGSLRASLTQVLRHIGVDANVRVFALRAETIKRARSLEKLIRLTGKGTLVFDRTRALQRSEALLTLTSQVRSDLGSVADGICFQSERRTLFVSLSRSAFAGQSPDAVSTTISGLLQRLESLTGVWRSALGADAFDLAVRIGFAIPAGLDLIAVDGRTARGIILRAMTRPMQNNFGKVALGALMGFAVTAPALAEGPAVDGFNVTIMTRGGPVRDAIKFDHLWAGLGIKATAPLGERFGAQLDLGIGTDMYYGAAAHLFARDPDLGLIGVMGSVETMYGERMDRLGVEGEFYLNDNFTVSGIAGYQSGTVPNGAFGRIDLKFYPDPTLMLRVGGELRPDRSIARAGFEWQPAYDSLPGLSVYGDGSVTNAGDYRVLFGLNFQMGVNKPGTLIERHRRSDPGELVFNEFGEPAASPAYGGTAAN